MVAVATENVGRSGRGSWPSPAHFFSEGPLRKGAWGDCEEQAHLAAGSARRGRLDVAFEGVPVTALAIGRVAMDNNTDMDATDLNRVSSVARGTIWDPRADMDDEECETNEESRTNN